MSATFWNMRRRKAAEQAKKQQAEKAAPAEKTKPKAKEGAK